MDIMEGGYPPLDSFNSRCTDRQTDRHHHLTSSHKKRGGRRRGDGGGEAADTHGKIHSPSALLVSDLPADNVQSVR